MGVDVLYVLGLCMEEEICVVVFFVDFLVNVVMGFIGVLFILDDFWEWGVIRVSVGSVL